MKGTWNFYSTRTRFPLPAREEPGAFADGLGTPAFSTAWAAPAPLAPSGEITHLGEPTLNARGGDVARWSDLTPWGEPPPELEIR